jgi:hypothetical protein
MRGVSGLVAVVGGFRLHMHSRRVVMNADRADMRRDLLCGSCYRYCDDAESKEKGSKFQVFHGYYSIPMLIGRIAHKAGFRKILEQATLVWGVSRRYWRNEPIAATMRFGARGTCLVHIC